MVLHRDPSLQKSMDCSNCCARKIANWKRFAKAERSVEGILHHTLLEKSYDDENGLWMVKIFIFTITFFIHVIKAQWFNNAIVKIPKISKWQNKNFSSDFKFWKWMNIWFYFHNCEDVTFYGGDIIQFLMKPQVFFGFYMMLWSILNNC